MVRGFKGRGFKEEGGFNPLVKLEGPSCTTVIVKRIKRSCGERPFKSSGSVDFTRMGSTCCVSLATRL